MRGVVSELLVCRGGVCWDAAWLELHPHIAQGCWVDSGRGGNSGGKLNEVGSASDITSSF